MRKFREFSSLHANVEKCEACWIGCSKCRTDKPVNCKVTSLIKSSIKILGVHYSYNREVAEDKKLFRANKRHEKSVKYLETGFQIIDCL